MFRIIINASCNSVTVCNDLYVPLGFLVHFQYSLNGIQCKFDAIKSVAVTLQERAHYQLLLQTLLASLPPWSYKCCVIMFVYNAIVSLCFIKMLCVYRIRLIFRSFALTVFTSVIDVRTDSLNIGPVIGRNTAIIRQIENSHREIRFFF